MLLARRAAGVTLALVLGTARPGVAQTTVSTEPGDATTTIAVSSSTFGQTFIAPNATDVFLQSIRLAGATGAPGPFTAHLFEFDPATIRVVGAPLFSAGGVGQPAGLPFPFPTFTPNVLLDPARTYLFLLETGSPFNFTQFGTVPYAAGAAVQAFGPDVPSAIFLDIGGDIAFTARFGAAPTAIPEPVTAAMLAAGLVGVGAAARRRRVGGATGDR
jgi:hypothetical protein